MPLTDPAIRNAKAESKPVKLFDSGGLFLLVTPAGGKWWRFKYRFGGKEKLLSLGTYPEVSLKDARGNRDDARALLRAGVDPGEKRKAEKISSAGAGSFETVAREWLGKQTHWSAGHRRTVELRLKNYVFPWLGRREINEVTAPEVLAVLRRQESRGAVETAHRVKAICGQIFRYAVRTERAERDPTADLRDAIASPNHKRMAAITDPRQIGGLLRAIDGYQGFFPTTCALKLAPLLFVRPGELRHAEWSEIDLDDTVWRIPAEKMKNRLPHVVPLSRQAVAILNELRPLTGDGKYLFPSLRSSSYPMSNNTVLAALRRMGFQKDEMSGHGFRAMASTILHEQGWPSAIIERQLAHQERNKVKAAYNHAQHLPERRKMMQSWADYLDGLKSGEGKIVSIRAAG